MLPGSEARRLDRSEQFALIAAREAWARRRAGRPEVDARAARRRSWASGIGGVTTTLDRYDTCKEKGWKPASRPHTVPMLMPNGPAGLVGLELGAQAGVHALASACATGAEAIGYAST